MRTASVTLACSASALLLACGGGGGSMSSPSNSGSGTGQHVAAGAVTLTDVLTYHNDTARTAENIMKDVYNRLGLDYHTYVTTINNEGCKVYHS